MTSIRALAILDSIKRVEFSLRDGQEMIVKTTQFTDQQKEIISIIGVAPVGV